MNILIKKYKEAWENHDLNLIRELFTDDAIYIEKKNEVIFKGINEILNYWKNNAQNQRNVIFNPDYIKNKNSTIEVGWKASFFRRDLERNIYLEGILWMKVKDGKIYHFSEKFKKHF